MQRFAIQQIHIVPMSKRWHEPKQIKWIVQNAQILKLTADQVQSYTASSSSTQHSKVGLVSIE